ncbi:hypothetical protein C7S14_7963 [Burkholderia cepacia]|nr:hypothetical protein C7S14_7963 [Burkholderia cepacia]
MDMHRQSRALLAAVIGGAMHAHGQPKRHGRIIRISQFGIHW